VIVGYLLRTTRIYTIGSLLVLVFGLILTGMTHKFSQWWISVSLTLFVVAFVLLVLILRDMRKAVTSLDAAAGRPAPASAGGAVADAVEEDVRADAADADAEADAARSVPQTTGVAAAGAPSVTAAAPPPAAIAAPPAATRSADNRVAAVERGRIAGYGGVTSLIWLVILVLMIWH
jgi:hypothetical protein